MAAKPLQIEIRSTMLRVIFLSWRSYSRVSWVGVASQALQVFERNALFEQIGDGRHAEGVAGRWPVCMDTLWQQLEARHGKANIKTEMLRSTFQRVFEKSLGLCPPK
jgi:hypothetical protein